MWDTHGQEPKSHNLKGEHKNFVWGEEKKEPIVLTYSQYSRLKTRKSLKVIGVMPCGAEC